jgi:probable HAF family extracellular repeat protein
MFLRLTIVISLLCGHTTLATAGITFQVIDSVLGNQFYGLPFSLSGDGSVAAGVTSSPFSPSDRAFRWTQATGMQGIGDLPGGEFTSEARGVSLDGSVIVGRSVSGNGVEAFRWTSSTKMVGLGDLPGHRFYSVGTAVSADGSAVTGYSEGPQGFEPFRWTTATGMVGLDPNGPFPGKAVGISADGSAIAGTTTAGKAFRWTSAGGIQQLGALPTSVDGVSEAWAISADGSTVVGYGTNGGPFWEAIRWTAAGGMQSLGDLPGGPIHGYATSVSGDGSVIVGMSAIAGGGQVPFLWTEAQGMRNLQQLFIDHGIERVAGHGMTVWAISADGNVLAGVILDDSVAHMWVATIPEPSTLAMALGGLTISGLVALRRQRRQRQAG